jgi:hypothetical protein
MGIMAGIVLAADLFIPGVTTSELGLQSGLVAVVGLITYFRGC